MFKVLIAEDDLMIADMIEEVLLQNQYQVCGIAPTVTEAVALGRRHKPDLAIIDMRLEDGGYGTDVANQLGALGRLGILFTTGNPPQLMRAAVSGDACLAKPYRDIDLLRALEIVAEIVSTGTATPPFPRGFQLLPSTATPLGSTRHE